MRFLHILSYTLLATLYLGTYEGMLALWKNGQVFPEKIYPCAVKTLPAQDQALLQDGIPIGSQAELTAYLEDLLS